MYTAKEFEEDLKCLSVKKESKVTDWNVGDKVKVTKDSMQVMWSGNRGIEHFPDDNYLKKIQKIFKNNEVGVVTHRFKPGYKMTVEFPSGSFHMKDNFVEKA